MRNWAVTRGLLFSASAAAALLLTACPKPPPPPPPTTPAPTPTPVPTPTPIPALVRKPLPTATLFNGIALESAVVAEPGADLASADRKENNAYKVEVTLRLRLPRPAATLEDILSNKPDLAAVLPTLPTLLANATVSPFFEKFYDLKVRDVRRKQANLDAVLSRHNFYDCETMLELQNPATSRRALLVLSDMDVNTDGSDGDRNVAVDTSSMFFLPQTSYRWPKQTPRVNPCLPIEEKKLADFEAELAKPGLKPARVQEIKDGIDLAKRRIHDLKKWSFLVSSVDPFIVLPGFIMRDHTGPFVPKVGDYAVVIHEGRAFPAILGDSGPSHKAGEASLLLCRELNGNSSNLSRPISDLKVAYVVFPGSAEPENTPPDLEKWQAKCQILIDELGGLGVPLHTWPNRVPPWPTPTPRPEPTPAPSPQESLTPSPEAR
ncbi:MAG: hypothetical protein RL630_2261 [Verrucomicrobiota bacterium]|jgi:hypothetical protein